MVVINEPLDRLIKYYRKPEDLTGGNGLLKQLNKMLSEKTMQAAMAVHIGYSPHSLAGNKTGK